MSVDLLSVHIPKCGGTSFYRCLKLAIPYPATVTPIYPQLPGEADSCPDDAQVVHGHVSWDYVEADRRVVWLRDPVDRVGSHFCYWQKVQPQGHPAHEAVYNDLITFEEFIYRPDIRNLATREYLSGATLDDFDAVGLLESYDESLKRIGKILDLNLWPIHHNEVRGQEYETFRSMVLVQWAETIRSLNGADHELWVEATERFSV